MAPLLKLLQQRSQEPWLTGLDQTACLALAQNLHHQLTTDFSEPFDHRILLATAEPDVFLAGLVAAITGGYDLFLANAHWTDREQQTVLSLVQPTLRLHDRTWHPLTPSPPSTSTFPPYPPCIMIPTSGSSGQIRFAIHTWDTLLASVQGFRQYFQVDRVNSFCVLPLHHVSGLMQFVRSFSSGGQLVIQPFKTLLVDQDLAIPPQNCFLSLVPTQLQRLLDADRAFASRLTHFQAILLGGAPAWAELLERARADRLPLAPTYGMTETAAQVATLKPADFLAGNQSCGQALPHARLTIRDPKGNPLPPNQTGLIHIQANSLCRGYYEIHSSNPSPEKGSLDQIQNLSPAPTAYSPIPSEFSTDDLGYLDTTGYLYILGRNSGKIITGGENVFPAEVEAAIRSTGLVQDVCVVGQPDHDWGEVVTAVYVPNQADTSPQQLKAAIADRLSRYKQPKQWIAVDGLPRNAQGKINHTELQATLESQLFQKSQESTTSSRLLLVIGNSRLHWAWLEQGQVQTIWHSPHLSPDEIEQLMTSQFDFSIIAPSPHHSIAPLPHRPIAPSCPLVIASVVPEQTQRWQTYPQARVLTLADIPLQGFYPTLGIDRALALLGAAETFGCPVLAIDGGTALTLTGLDGQRCLVGGAILPGLGLQQQSLAQGTAALPFMAWKNPEHRPDRWAKNTQEAIQSGILYTLLAGLRDFITDWLQRFPTSTIVLTGGDGEILYQQLQQDALALAHPLQYDPALIFRGLSTLE